MKYYIRFPLLCFFTLLFSFSTIAKNADITISSEGLTQATPTILTTNSSLDTTQYQEVATTIASTLNISLFNQGFFYGFLLMVILLNFICHALFNEKSFGYFGLALTAFAVLFFNADNLMPLLIVDTSSFTVALNTTLVCATMGLMALFSAKYLNIEELYPNLKAITKPLFICAVVATIVTWFLENQVFAVIANVLSFILMGSYFFAGILLFSRKNYAKFYVITSSIPLLFAIDYFLLDGLGIEFLNTDTIHIKTAFFVEMIVMTYAIVFRMNAIKEENAQRKTEMQIYLQKQENMSRESIVKIIEDVYLENLIMHYDLDGVEIKLLQYISEGKTNAKIARKLNTTENDIELMTKELYHKLEISESVSEDVRLLESQPDYLYN